MEIPKDIAIPIANELLAEYPGDSLGSIDPQGDIPPSPGQTQGFRDSPE